MKTDREWRTVVTGHRPPVLGGYGDRARRELEDFAVVELGRLVETQPEGKGLVVTGMALGWDQAVATAARDLGIPYLAALPFPTMGEHWPADSYARMKRLCEVATRVVMVDDGDPASWKFIKRDKWMVDYARAADDNTCLALWSGVRKGGTWATIQAAREAFVIVENCWGRWIDQRPEALEKTA